MKNIGSGSCGGIWHQLNANFFVEYKKKSNALRSIDVDSVQLKNNRDMLLSNQSYGSYISSINQLHAMQVNLGPYTKINLLSMRELALSKCRNFVGKHISITHTKPGFVSRQLAPKSQRWPGRVIRLVL